MTIPLTRFSDLVHLNTDRTADPASAGINRFVGLEHTKPEHQERIAEAYHAFKDVEGFAKVASLEDIRANDGNLSIPLYVRGRVVSEEQGDYATNGLRDATHSWEDSSTSLNRSLNTLLEALE